MAEKLLIETGKADKNNVSKIIEDLCFFPIWHERTINSWVFDDEIRDYVLNNLKHCDEEIGLKVLEILTKYKNNSKNLNIWEQIDYDLQIARLSLQFEKTLGEGINLLRKMFDAAYVLNQFEIQRVIDLYLENFYPKPSVVEERLSEETKSAYFMRGLIAFNNNEFEKAFNFLISVWKGNAETENSIDAAISSNIVGLIWSEESSHWKEAERAYRESIELFKKINDLSGQAQVNNYLGNLLGKQSSRWNDAEFAHKESIKLFKKVNDIFSQAKVNYNLGNLLSKESSHWNDTEFAYRESIKLLKETNDSSGYAQAHSILGNLLCERPLSMEEAENAYKQYLLCKNSNNENVPNEIFKERAQYLVNVDDMMYEMYCEPIFDKRAGISKNAPFYSSNIERVNKIKVVDQLFASKEYQTFIQLTRPEDISKRKFQPIPHKKLRENEFGDLNLERND